MPVLPVLPRRAAALCVVLVAAALSPSRSLPGRSGPRGERQGGAGPRRPRLLGWQVAQREGRGEGWYNKDYRYSRDDDASAYWHFGKMRGEYRAKIWYIDHTKVKRAEPEADADTSGDHLAEAQLAGRGPVGEALRLGGRPAIQRATGGTTGSPAGGIGTMWSWTGTSTSRSAPAAPTTRGYGHGSVLAADAFMFERTLPHPQDLDIAIAACKQDVSVRLWFRTTAMAKECEYQLRDGKWAWVPTPKTAESFLTHHHDSRGRARPDYSSNIFDLILRSQLPPGADMQRPITAEEATRITDALLRRWPRGVFR